MPVSICIVNWNTKEHLRRCLLACLQELQRIEAEVIVVDNASGDGSADLVRAEFPQANLIANPRNENYARGNNQAIEASSGEFVLLLNPDVELRPGAIRRMVEFLRDLPEAGAVGCKLVGPDGKIQPSCRRFPDPWCLLWEATGLSTLFPHSELFGRYQMTYWDYQDVRQVDQPMASCLLLRRQALDQVGLFDEDFRLFFNDVDLCWRLKLAGWRIYYTPEAEALHEHAASTRQLPRAATVDESRRSLIRFYQKHYRQRLNPLAYWASLALIEAGRALSVIWFALADSLGRRSPARAPLRPGSVDTPASPPV